ncbi:Dcp2, box A domain-containing protein [Dactylonectria macrodidyma]|uniref:Dcp2, box A domain-containing protein n=1 Tax=Dactylonectria macrodidyma TaxID=307937 RepID=A0A9P9DZ40_9HYPO|nr:Dcp2, box A domain-containing protein [Dactylonectria macrodidyma]
MAQMQLEDWLDDLCVRFIINLPQEDLSSVARICFQVEEAQWFYEDFIRPLDPTLPSMSLRTFCLRIFQHCPLLASFSVENHTKAFEEFLEYKTRIPVRGAIMLNEAMDSTVLVKGWKKGANWSFPRGKINKDEDDLDCAIREVYEETGLDLRAAGLVPTEVKPKYIEISMREQHMRLYVFRDVPMDTDFEPKTRKEISKIQWYKLSDLPAFRKKGQNNDSGTVPNANKFYMVAPFLVPLKKWVVSQKKMEARRAASGNHAHLHRPIDEVHLEDDWTQTDTGADIPTGTPAIETLEGATQELQRLLRVQPPTQGIQPAPPQPDKGSALLSILQAGPGSTTAAQRPAQLLHTPHDLMIVEAPQAHTPHYHNHYHQVPSIDTHQTPPSFSLPPNQAGWNAPLVQPGNEQAFNQQYPLALQQQYGSNQATLVHPQPLPPQVQRAVFNRSVFQEGPQPTYAGAFANPQQAQYSVPGQMAPGQIPPSQMMPNQIPPPQGPIPLDNSRPAPLNGQSMALLNAFKGGIAGSQLKENAKQTHPYPQAHAQPHQLPGQGIMGQNYPQSYNQQQVAPRPPAHMVGTLASHDRSQPSPKELAGSKVGPPEDNHRSALLGMFRKADPEANTGQAQHHNAAHMNSQGASGNMLNELLRGGSSSRAQGPSRGSVDTNPSLSLDTLSIQHQPSQSGTPASQGRGDYASQYPPQPAAQTAHQTQPLRILQRGQNDQFLGVGGQASVSPQTSPRGVGGHPPPGHFASPSTVAAFPAQGAPNPRPGSGPDQKRQLLSLFGKQSPGLEASKGKEVVVEAPRSRLASVASGTGDMLAAGSTATSRRGSQTPMTSADRTFLLGYLESVTNNATR